MTLTEFKRFADENNIVPVSTEIYSQMISDSVKYAKMKEVLQEICQEIESLTIARVDDNYVRNMAGLYCVKREIIEIIDKHIKEYEE